MLNRYLSSELPGHTWEKPHKKQKKIIFGILIDEPSMLRVSFLRSQACPYSALNEGVLTTGTYLEAPRQYREEFTARHSDERRESVS